MARPRQIRITARKSTLNLRAVIHRTNLVGYSSSATDGRGFRGLGSQFVPVSGKTMDLQEFKVGGYTRTGDEFFGFEGSIIMEELDQDGVCQPGKMYFWADVPADPDDPESVAMYGWYNDEDWSLIEGVSFNPGDGFIIQSDSDDWTLQSSGAVLDKKSGGVAVNLDGRGFKYIANVMPITINLNDYDEDGNWLTIGGYDRKDPEFCGFEGSIIAEDLDQDGVCQPGKMYFWADVPADPDDPDSVAMYGWYNDEDWSLIEGVSFDPGYGLLVQSDSDDWTVVIPGVDIK